MLSETELSVLQYLQEQYTLSPLLSLISFSFKPLSFALFPLQIFSNVIFL